MGKVSRVGALEKEARESNYAPMMARRVDEISNGNPSDNTLSGRRFRKGKSMSHGRIEGLGVATTRVLNQVNKI